MHVVEHQSLEQAGELREAWGALLAQTPNGSFCQSWEWLAVHYRHVEHLRRPRIVSLVDGGEIVSILPLSVERQRRKLGALRVLSLAGDGWTSFSGAMGREPERALEVCVDHLRHHARNFDLLDLNGLRCSSSAEATPFKAERPVALIDLDGDWEAYWESRKANANRRRNIERCERRLSEQGKVEYVRYRPLGLAHGDSDPRWDLYDACESLAKLSWQSGLTEGNTISHGCVREFLREAHVVAAECGGLELNLLYLDGRPLAFVYGYHYRGYLDLIRAGFHPEFGKLAPGNALWTRLIRDSFDRGDRVLDLGRSCLDYKQVWLTRIEHQHSLCYYPLTVRGQALRMAHWLRRRWPSQLNDSNQRFKNQVAEQSSPQPADVIVESNRV